MDNISKISVCLVAADLPLYKPSVCSVCSLDENITFFVQTSLQKSKCNNKQKYIGLLGP